MMPMAFKNDVMQFEKLGHLDFPSSSSSPILTPLHTLSIACALSSSFVFSSRSFRNETSF